MRLMPRNSRFHPRVLCVEDDVAAGITTSGRRVRAIIAELQDRGVEVVEAYSFDDAAACFASDAAIHCILIDWSLGTNDKKSHAAATALLRDIRAHNADVPIFLMADRKVVGTMSVEVAGLADEFIWILQDTAPFIANRVAASIDRYIDALLPPFSRALVEYDRDAEYSWAAPGHQGGVAFSKSPIGRIFVDTYGEMLFRTDMGVERGGLGSLLLHSGPIGASEAYAARVFGSDRSYTVLNGTSASNRSIMSACVSDNELVLCDRNCHKSIEQGLAQTGGIPVFLQANRNRYGVIGPIHPNQMKPKAIQARIAANPLASKVRKKRPVYTVITNCTYDGMCYDAKTAQDLLAQSVDRIHFDEAWYGYARFNPMYRDRYAMRGDAADHPDDGPTVFATHSTHKLLSALSQTSFIHVRDGRQAIDHDRFNEAYCAQATTSPLYALIASNEVAAAMMDGPSGRSLIQDVIDEAVACRQAMARAHREFARKKDWFFSPWNAPTVKGPGGKRIDFADAPAELLASDPNCWVLHPGEKWHGFDDLPDGWCLMDPVKFGIVCPGMGEDGKLAKNGIPGDLVTAYLGQHGIVPSRTTSHMVLFLFSMGVTKGKWGTLINTLLDFKRDYDTNAPLAKAMPKVVAAAPDLYGKMGVKDLADRMWKMLTTSRLGPSEADAYAKLPKPVMPPRQAFQKLMSGEAELVPLSKVANRISGVGVIPYPPGIPIVMPGENFGPANGAWISYLKALQEWGETFPGFAKEVEGTVEKDGTYYIYCLK
jgi:arginine decarboxylase